MPLPDDAVHRVFGSAHPSAVYPFSQPFAYLDGNGYAFSDRYLYPHADPYAHPHAYAGAGRYAICPES